RPSSRSRTSRPGSATPRSTAAARTPPPSSFASSTRRASGPPPSPPGGRTSSGAAPARDGRGGSLYPALVPRLALAAPLALLLLSTTAHAGPISFVEQRKNFMVFDDDGTVEHANWFSREGFYGGYYPLEQGFLAVHPDDAQFIVVYSTFDLVDGV